MSAVLTKGVIDETAELEVLAAEAKKALAEVKGFFKKTVPAYWRAGMALHFARKQFGKRKGWRKWLEDNNVATGTASEVIRLYNADPNGERLDEFATITEAKKGLGILKTKPKADPWASFESIVSYIEDTMGKLRSASEKLGKKDGLKLVNEVIVEATKLRKELEAA